MCCSLNFSHSFFTPLCSCSSNFHPFLLNLCSEAHGNSSIIWEQRRTKRRIGITHNFEQQRNYFMMAMGWIGMRHIIHWTRNIKYHHAEIMGFSQNGLVFSHRVFAYIFLFIYFFTMLLSFTFASFLREITQKKIVAFSILLYTLIIEKKMENRFSVLKWACHFHM